MGEIDYNYTQPNGLSPEEQHNVAVENESPASAQESASCEKKKCRCKCGLIIDIVLLLAVIALFILHFCDGKCCKKSDDVTGGITSSTAVAGQPGTGEVIFINLDTINEHYIYFKEKKAELESQLAAQEASFSKKQQDFQKKYTQFQQNMQAGVLTEIQIQNAQQQLEAEYAKLEQEASAARERLETMTAGVNSTMLDSLKSSAARVSAARNASYVFTYSNDMPILICADPTKDVTNEVLHDMNAPFEKAK